MKGITLQKTASPNEEGGRGSWGKEGMDGKGDISLRERGEAV